MNNLYKIQTSQTTWRPKQKLEFGAFTKLYLEPYPLHLGHTVDWKRLTETNF